MALFKVKICGITQKPDAEFVIAQGCKREVAIGLNFYKAGKRYVSPDLVVKWNLDRHANKAAQLVGVFVNEPLGSILQIAEQLNLDGVQLHGDEGPDLVERLSRQLPTDTIIIRAVRTTAESNLIEKTQSEIDSWVEAGVSAILLDAAKEGSYGGTGSKLDWNNVGNLKISVPWILAGGLNPDNVAQAIALASPDSVDVASGVESAPGKKDGQLVDAFIQESNRGFE